MRKGSTVLTTFSMRTDAEIFQHFLVAAGIESEIQGDDASGWAPHVGFSTGGLSVSVKNEDLEFASDLLANLENF